MKDDRKDERLKMKDEKLRLENVYMMSGSSKSHQPRGLYVVPSLWREFALPAERTDM